ncbi:unnamed protein product, partial [Symbiodinium necroappetens]
VGDPAPRAERPPAAQRSLGSASGSDGDECGCAAPQLEAHRDGLGQRGGAVGLGLWAFRHLPVWYYAASLGCHHRAPDGGTVPFRSGCQPSGPGWAAAHATRRGSSTAQPSPHRRAPTGERLCRRPSTALCGGWRLHGCCHFPLGQEL